MHKQPSLTSQHMVKRSSNPSPNDGPKGSSRPTCPTPFPGGNWPSKVPGVKSGGNRGQGPKA